MRRHRGVRCALAGASGLALGLALLVTACSYVAAPKAAQGSAVRTSGSTGTRRWAFGQPDGITASRTGIWVSDGLVNAVYEFRPATGALVRIIAGPRYRFDDPDGIVADQGRIWVASARNNVVTELSATGALIRVIGGRRYQFSVPQGITADAGRIWVASTDRVTEFSAATGAFIRVIGGSRYQFSTLDGIAAADSRLWVPNGDAVTEISARTGALIRVIGGSQYRFNGPDVAAVAGGHVWIGNFNSDSVTEFWATTGRLVRVTRHLPNVPLAIAASPGAAWVAMNSGAKGSDIAGPDGSVAELRARTGAIIRVISAVRYHVADPQADVVAGNHVWIASVNYPGPGGSVTEISAANGALIRVITGTQQHIATTAALTADAAGAGPVSLTP
jgi:hypothetical protein